jgi:hypothetical protein
LKTIDFDKNAPTVICVETITFSEKRQGIKLNSIINLLLEKGYLMYADTNINSIFVKKKVWLNSD